MTESKVDDLLPCPFCGVRGETEEIEADCWTVGCRGRCDFDLLSGPVGLGRWLTEADAVRAWNRRAPAALAACTPAKEEGR